MDSGSAPDPVEMTRLNRRNLNAMAQKCPNCSTPVSKKWLLFGFSSTDYKCPQCGHTLRWTSFRLLANFLVGLVFASPILFTYYRHISYLKLIPFLLVIGFLILLFCPKQFKDISRN